MASPMAGKGFESERRERNGQRDGEGTDDDQTQGQSGRNGGIHPLIVRTILAFSDPFDDTQRAVVGQLWWSARSGFGVLQAGQTGQSSPCSNSRSHVHFRPGSARLFEPSFHREFKI